MSQAQANVQIQMVPKHTIQKEVLGAAAVMAKAQSEIMEKIAILRQIKEMVQSSASAISMLAIQGSSGAIATEGMAGRSELALLEKVLSELAKASQSIGSVVNGKIYTAIIGGE